MTKIENSTQDLLRKIAQQNANPTFKKLEPQANA